jgi:hypothetical protein
MDKGCRVVGLANGTGWCGTTSILVVRHHCSKWRIVRKCGHENYHKGVSMTRLGKIARLSREIRDESNVRLQNGEAGRQLVEWLNGLPAAQEVLKERFEGRAVTEQNLSEWKQGGYEDWVRHQENCAYALMLTEMAEDLEEEAGNTRLEERLAALMAVALARLLREAEEAPAGPERTKMILDVARQLSQLRRDGQQAERVRMERERWEEKQLEIELKQRKEAEERARTQAIWEQTAAEFPALARMSVGKGEVKPPRKPRGCAEDEGGGARPPQKRERTKGDGARANANPLQEHKPKREPPHPDPLLHKRVEEREMEGRARVQGIHAPGSSANSLPQEREWKEAARGESDQIAPNQTCEETEEVGKRKKEESADTQAMAQPRGETSP